MLQRKVLLRIHLKRVRTISLLGIFRGIVVVIWCALLLFSFSLYPCPRPTIFP